MARCHITPHKIIYLLHWQNWEDIRALWELVCLPLGRLRPVWIRALITIYRKLYQSGDYPIFGTIMATDVPFCRRGKIDRVIPCFSASSLAMCNPKPEPSTDLFDLSRNLTERVFTQSNSSGVRPGPVSWTSMRSLSFTLERKGQAAH